MVIPISDKLPSQTFITNKLQFSIFFYNFCYKICYY